MSLTEYLSLDLSDTPGKRVELAQHLSKASLEDAESHAADAAQSISGLAVRLKELIIAIKSPEAANSREEALYLLRFLRNCCTSGLFFHQVVLSAQIPALCAALLSSLPTAPPSPDLDKSFQQLSAAVIQFLTNMTVEDESLIERYWPDALSVLETAFGRAEEGRGPPPLASSLHPALLLLAACTRLDPASHPALLPALLAPSFLASVLHPLLLRIGPDDSAPDHLKSLLFQVVTSIAVHHTSLLPVLLSALRLPHLLHVYATDPFPQPDPERPTVHVSPQGEVFPPVDPPLGEDQVVALNVILDCLIDDAHHKLDTTYAERKALGVNPLDLERYLSPELQRGISTALHLAATAARAAEDRSSSSSSDYNRSLEDYRSPARALHSSIALLRLLTSHDGATVGPGENSADPAVAARRRAQTSSIRYEGAWSSGVLARVVGLLGSLRPIRNPRRPEVPGPASEPPGRHWPALLPASRIYPIEPPYPSYRTEVVSILANPPYRRKWMQDALASLHASELLLSQCQLDEESPLCREWSLWAVRNLCEDNDTVQELIRALKVEDVIETPEMAQMGVRVELDKETGKLKTVKAEKGKEEGPSDQGPPS